MKLTAEEASATRPRATFLIEGVKLVTQIARLVLEGASLVSSEAGHVPGLVDLVTGRWSGQDDAVAFAIVGMSVASGERRLVIAARSLVAGSAALVRREGREQEDGASFVTALPYFVLASVAYVSRGECLVPGGGSEAISRASLLSVVLRLATERRKLVIARTSLVFRGARVICGFRSPAAR